jgi:hypothetical protein
VLERVGRVLRFSPEGREVRVWVRGMPGADETEVVAGLLTDVTDSRAVLTLRPPEGGSRRLSVEPHEAGWGFHALWFSFISVDVFEADGGDPVGRWFIRLGSP